MAQTIIDFSHLTPAERIELAQQLWDSLEPETIVLDETVVAELRRRRAELKDDGELGEPWEQVIHDIEKRGA